jgi:hypothetical protein
MKYILKAIGACNADKKQDFVARLETPEVNMELWNDTCKCWFNSMPQLEIGDIFIVYVVKGEPRNNGKFKGRIFGYCEVVSQVCSGRLEKRWHKYVIVKNLCKSFSEKSKYKEILNIADFNVEFNLGTIRRGYTVLDNDKAQEIIKAIERNK